MLPSKLREELLSTLRVSPPSLTRRAQEIARVFGPMSTDEAKLIMAHDAGINIGKHVTQEQLETVRRLRLNMPATTSPKPLVISRRQVTEEPSIKRFEVKPPSRRTLFDERDLHPFVTKSSRNLFTGGHYTEAVRKSFQGLNNRVKRMANLPQADGYDLMSRTFKIEKPLLQLSGLGTPTEQDEQRGLHHLMMGAMSALRNPNTHEDVWTTDATTALEALAFASLLHRYLDVCDEYTQVASANS